MGRQEFSKGKTIITSYGGAGGMVSGSCHTLETRGFKLMVDCGEVQGNRDKKIEKNQRRTISSFDMFKGVDSLLITHAHADHVARAPESFAKDFRLRVYATKETVDFMRPILADSVSIQLKKSRSQDKNQNKKCFEKPRYDVHDVEAMFRRTRGIEPFKEIPIENNITVEFILNGHIGGSSSILIRNYNNGINTLFLGDTGKPVQSLCGGYLDFAAKYPKDPIHILVMDTTNFEKDPASAEESIEELLNIFDETFNNGGNIVLPLLCLHRDPELREILHNNQNTGRISSRVKFHDDSPLSRKIRPIYTSEYLLPRFGNDPFFYKTVGESVSRFDLNNLTYIESHKESMMNDLELANGGQETVVLASGGMGDHGRSVNYLNGEFCKNPKNAVVWTCHQVEGTPGANMLYREKYSSDRKCGAKVYSLGGFTSHASKFEIFDCIERYNLSELRVVYNVHGKESSMEKSMMETMKRYSGVRVFNSKIGEPIEIYH